MKASELTYSQPEQEPLPYYARILLLHWQKTNPQLVRSLERAGRLRAELLDRDQQANDQLADEALRLQREKRLSPAQAYQVAREQLLSNLLNRPLVLSGL
jgi:hypothetical protein